MNRPTRHIPLVILIGILTTCSACTKPQFDLIVESINLEALDKFDSTVPGFNGLISEVGDIELDTDRRIYILDRIERHVLVIDSTHTVINIIGRDGDGPGVIRIHHQSSNHLLAVGGGFIVIGSDPNLIHVFDIEGNFLNRFTPHLLVCDLDVREDGTIVTHTYNSETSIIEYDAQGNTLREYGRAVIRTGMGDNKYPQFSIYNKGTLSLLPNDEFITFNTDWLWQLTTDGQFLRVFDCENGGSGNFTIRDGYIVFGAGTSIAVGTIPSQPN